MFTTCYSCLILLETLTRLPNTPNPFKNPPNSTILFAKTVRRQICVSSVRLYAILSSCVHRKAATMDRKGRQRDPSTLAHAPERRRMDSAFASKGGKTIVSIFVTCTSGSIVHVLILMIKLHMYLDERS
jgi:hypothetical protein